MTKPALAPDEPVEIEEVHDYQYGEPTENGPRWLTREEYFASLEEAEAEIARGETVSHAEVMAELRALQASLEAR